MERIKKLEIEYYQKLGKLFYAIAAADKIVHEAEYETLLQLVKSNWVPLDSYEDEFHTDAAFQIEIVFGWLDYQKYSADECFIEFKDFIKAHPSLFSQTRKKLIWKTANEIANAFAGKNKSELMMLAKLKLILKE